MKRSDPTEWAIFSHSRPRVIIARHVPLVLFGHSLLIPLITTRGTRDRRE